MVLVCRPVYNQTLLNNWTAQSYNSTLYQNASALGVGELITQCSAIAPNGSLVFTAPGPGFFLGKLSLMFWAQYATSTSDLQLSLASTDTTLPEVDLLLSTVCLYIDNSWSVELNLAQSTQAPPSMPFIQSFDAGGLAAVTHS